MTTVQFKSEISIELDQLLTGVAQLDTLDLEQLLIQIQQVLAHRQNPSLPASLTRRNSTEIQRSKRKNAIANCHS